MSRALPAPSLSFLRPAWWLAHPLRLAAGVVVLAAALAVAWYLVSPLFIRTRLEEQVSAAAAGGVVLARGAFDERDAIHKGAGTASLVRRADGATLLQLEQFRVTNGPDLYVYLTPAAAPSSHDDVTRDAVRLGRLKATDGTFSYELPPGVDPRAFRSAVIYCFQFRTIFSVAQLRTS